MKSQYGMKNIPSDLWAWLQEQAYAREIDINGFICDVLDYVRRGRTGRNPLNGRPPNRNTVTLGHADNGRAVKKQYCLRSIPEDIWRWVESESHASGRNINRFIVHTLETARDDSDQPRLFDERPVVKPAKPKIIPFTFIDLFAGIGGFRLGLQRLGGRCLFSSEWDRFCRQTYEHWFGDQQKGDITEISPEAIPDHDILAAGFPCQPFSIAGVSKKNSLGQKHGFDCDRQGNLFFTICDIALIKRPKAMILENVKNLRSHDKGRTWPVIAQSLDRIGYTMYDRIIDAAPYVPQHRERIFIVCFRKDLYGDAEGFRFPEPPDKPRPRFRDILEERPDPKYILTDHLWNYLQNYAKKHRAQGNGFGYGMTELDGISRTLSARYYKDGSEVLIPRQKSDPKVKGKGNRNPRRLTPVEAAWLMGFREVATRREDIPVSDTQAYKQFGNAVVPDVVEAVGRQVLKFMASSKQTARRRQKSGKVAAIA